MGGGADVGPAGGGGGANDVSCARAHSMNVNSEWTRAKVMSFALRMSAGNQRISNA